MRKERPCLAAEHLGRLKASGACLGIPYPKTDLQAVAVEGARRHGLEDASARITLTAGAGGDLAGPGDRPGALIVQIRSALGPGSGLKVHIPSFRQSATSVLMRHKTLRYLEGSGGREPAMPGRRAVFLNDWARSPRAAPNVFCRTGSFHPPGLQHPARRPDSWS